MQHGDAPGEQTEAVKLSALAQERVPIRCRFTKRSPLPSARLWDDGIGRANFIGVGNRGPSGIVYHFKVTCGRSKAKAE
jgi:hypothetical protein